MARPRNPVPQHQTDSPTRLRRLRVSPIRLILRWPIRAIASGLQRLQIFFRQFLRFLANAYIYLNGGQSEDDGAIIVTRNRWKAARRLWWHLLAMFATAAIASVNLVGYFIGATYLGPSDPSSQSLDHLAMQVTAKLYVRYINMQPLPRGMGN